MSATPPCWRPAQVEVRPRARPGTGAQPSRAQEPSPARSCRQAAACRRGVHRSDPATAGLLDRRARRPRARERAAPRDDWSSTTCSSSPGSCCATTPTSRARALQERFPRLLLDEFQDTDPIQIELAVRIAGGRDAAQPRLAGRRGPGRLAVRRRRPEAVDLPVPSRRHRACSSTPGTGSATTPTSAHHQLPHGRARPRLGQRRLRRADHRRPGRPARATSRSTLTSARPATGPPSPCSAPTTHAGQSARQRRPAARARGRRRRRRHPTRPR